MKLTITLPRPSTCFYAICFLASIWVFASAAAEMVAP